MSVVDVPIYHQKIKTNLAWRALQSDRALGAIGARGAGAASRQVVRRLHHVATSAPQDETCVAVCGW